MYLDTISERLRWAIQRSGRSVRSVQQELARRGVRGSSYASVHGYLRDPAAIPPMEFIEAAADVLGVRRAWLAFGEGAVEASGPELLADCVQALEHARAEMRRAIHAAVASGRPEVASEIRRVAVDLYAVYGRLSREVSNAHRDR